MAGRQPRARFCPEPLHRSEPLLLLPFVTPAEAGRRLARIGRA